MCSCLLTLTLKSQGQKGKVLLEAGEVEEQGTASLSFLPVPARPPPTPTHQAACMLCTRRIKKTVWPFEFWKVSLGKGRCQQRGTWERPTPLCCLCSLDSARRSECLSRFNGFLAHLNVSLLEQQQQQPFCRLYPSLARK